MKGCYKVKNLLGPYLYNVATPAERAAVEGHIDRCEKCADDLRSRKEILEKLELSLQFGDMPQKTQDDFAWNVYRRIASDAIRRRSRQIFLRRFVLQPSLATLVLAVGIAVGIIRLHPTPIIVREPSAVVVKAGEGDKKEIRAALYVEEFFRRQGAAHEKAVDKVSVPEQPSLDRDHLIQDALSPDSQRRLEDANLINYSLGDRKRALAEYQRLIDYYPDTDVATEARERIKVIFGSEYGIRVEKVSTKVGL